MTDGKRRIDRILDGAYLDGLTDRTLDEVRAMRVECSDEEAILSYERRMVHGRLAIMRKEIERREGSATGSLVDDLAQILSDDQPSNRGSFPGHDPQLTFDHPTRHISKLLSDDTLANLPELSIEEITSRITELVTVEEEVSGQRRSVHAVMNELNAEIARRYGSGEATPGDVLDP